MKPLANDDLRPGLIVIGMGNQRTNETPIYGEGMYGPPTSVITRQDNSYKGRVYHIDAVDLPFIVMTQVHTGYTRTNPKSYDGGPSTHDTRDGFRWGEVSAEILTALGLTDLIAKGKP